MSDTRKPRRAEGADRKDTGTPGGPVYSVVASGENVVLVNTQTGQTWAMAADGGHPVWQPVAFASGAARAPRRSEAKTPTGE